MRTPLLLTLLSHPMIRDLSETRAITHSLCLSEISVPVRLCKLGKDATHSRRRASDSGVSVSAV